MQREQLTEIDIQTEVEFELGKANYYGGVAHIILCSVVFKIIPFLHDHFAISLFSITGILLSSVCRLYLAPNQKKWYPAHRERWMLYFNIAIFTTAFCWGIMGAMGIYLYGIGSPAVSTLYLVLSGISAAGTNALIASQKHARIFVSLIMLQPLTALIIGNDPQGFMVGGILVLYYTFLNLQIGTQNKIHYANLVSRKEAIEDKIRFRALTEVGFEGVLIHVNGKIRAFNSTFLKIFGYKDEEAYGLEAINLITASDRDRAREMMKMPVTTGDLVGDRKDGTQFELQLVGQDCMYKGEKARMTAIRDISELTRSQDELIRSREEALEAARVKSEFLANMSHEIRTPMNGIIGMTGLLIDSHLNQEQNQLALTVRDCAEDLLEVINDILDYSKIEAGKIDLEIQPFSLKECVEQALYLLDYKASQKGVSLSYTVAADTPSEVLGDAGRIKQILINLIGNGVKFTSQGQVHLHLSAKVIEGDFYDLQFSIKDTGIGIPKDRINRLFKSFSQVDASTSRKFGGTGLGLAICKQLVEIMGGQISVESAEGHGSTFLFTLRVQALIQGVWKQKDKNEIYKIKNIAGDCPLRILVAEDNAINQKLILKLLEKMGYRADMAGNGVEALQAVKRQSYDVVFMDIQMPEMSGLEATMAIRASLPENEQPRIIALTANAMDGDREKYINLGMDGYVSKPIKVEALAAEIAKCRAIKGVEAPALRKMPS